jgi:hypothetical protein
MDIQTNAFFEITKSDKHDDGTMTVYGKATSDALDIDKQICDDDWLNRAMPDWFKSGGNIREQHSSIAAGVAKDYEKKDGAHWIRALVVDPTSVLKVDTGVLKGFSIGIKNPRIIRDDKAANGRIIDGIIVEVSLVDRPANPECQLVLAKSVGGKDGIWKVEELIEKTATEKEEPKMEKSATEIIAHARSISGDLTKFDKDLYETARNALAQLIVVEANEMQEGSDEEMSLSCLLGAVSNLMWWYRGEQAAGETEGETSEGETKNASTDEGGASAGADFEDPATPSETNTDEPANDAETPKVSDDELSEKIQTAVDEAIKSAMTPLHAKITELETVNKTATDKAITLEAELAVAKSLAVGNGPMRTAKPVNINAVSDLLTKANSYMSKSDATTDPDLREGFKILANKFFKEHEATLNKSSN